MKFRSLSKVGILSLILPLAAVAAEAKSDAKPAVPANAKPEAKPAVPAEAKAVAAASREIAMAIPKHGKLILKVPAAWKQEFQQPYPSLPPTLILSPEQGDAFKFMLTPLWSSKKDPSFNNPASVKRLAQGTLRMMLPGAVETTVKLQDLKGASASGYYFLVTDKAPGPGEYLYAVNGEFGVGDLLVHVTILLRDKNDANLAVALKALEAMEQKKE